MVALIQSQIFLIPVIFGLGWLRQVTNHVPEPYMDEIFHIPQAQKYCNGKWFEWDDKITTPPGLYAIGVFLHRIWMLKGCSAMTLRATNLVATFLLAIMSAHCRRLIEARLVDRNGRPSHHSKSLSFYVVHTGTNIALFPVIFFFSALYYTDVFSTLVVVLAFFNHLQRVAPEGKSWFSDVATVLFGVGSLFMRQTNVFWVVVFMGGLEAIHTVRTLRPVPVQKPENMKSLMDLVKFYGWRYSLGEIHDPPLNLAWVDDWLFCVASIAIAVICNPFLVLKQIWSYVVVMGLFVVFVLWNGSVVLGDKSNHVATLHFPQMLYIWPLFAFFSAPLLLPSFMWPVNVGWNGWFEQVKVGKQKEDRQREKPEKTGRNDADKSIAPLLHWVLTSKLPISTVYGLCSLAISFLVVKFNTILHPFTLADNRHYMFYVFRYTILRSSWVRYLLVPVYTFCRQITWTRLGGCWVNRYAPQNTDCPVTKQKGQHIAFYNRPFTEGFTQCVLAEAGKSGVVKQKRRHEQETNPVEGALVDAECTSTIPPSTSTALLWLFTTTISLMTAPLVEPRYFILPWVFWRLLLPAWPAHSCIAPARSENRLAALNGPVGWLFRKGKEADVRLFLETAWFIVVNLATMYIFVNRPFFWKTADGTYLDEGRVQRFMW